MAEMPHTDVERSFLPLARFSLGLFLVLGIVHLLALLDWFVLPRVFAWAGIPLVVPGHLVMMAGILSVRHPPGINRRLSRGERWKVCWEGVRRIPWQWRIAAAVFFYVYLPWTVISMAIAEGNQPPGNGAAGGWLPQDNREIVFVTLGGMAFSLAHYLILRYPLPRRVEILDQVIQGNGSKSVSC